MEVRRYVQEYGKDIIKRYEGIDTEWAETRTRLINRTIELHKRYYMTAFEAVKHITKIADGAYDKEA